MKPIYIFCFFKAVHSYFIQLFGIFQSKLSGSIMDFDLDIVNPEEQEEGLESSESLRRHLIIQSGEKSNKCKQCRFACSHQITLRRHLKNTVEKNQINAINVTMRPFIQALWRSIWKNTVEKNQTNANNVTMSLLI